MSIGKDLKRFREKAIKKGMPLLSEDEIVEGKPGVADVHSYPRALSKKEIFHLYQSFKRKSRKLVKPTPLPRYDKDFYEFTKWLDKQ